MIQIMVSHVIHRLRSRYCERYKIVMAELTLLVVIERAK